MNVCCKHCGSEVLDLYSSWTRYMPEDQHEVTAYICKRCGYISAYNEDEIVKITSKMRKRAIALDNTA